MATPTTLAEAARRTAALVDEVVNQIELGAWKREHVNDDPGSAAEMRAKAAWLRSRKHLPRYAEVVAYYREALPTHYTDSDVAFLARCDVREWARLREELAQRGTVTRAPVTIF